jgi:hypothetical protein
METRGGGGEVELSCVGCCCDRGLIKIRCVIAFLLFMGEGI